jgi:hypothetical protein
MSYNFSFSVASRPTTFDQQLIEIQYILSENDKGLSAPWWSDIVIERVASSDGSLLPKVLINEYGRLLSQIRDLSTGGDVDSGAAKMAQRLLWRAMFAGAIAPDVSWHNDAIVLFWKSGPKTSFFTIDADFFSYLEECDGAITKRADDLQPQVWESIFPLSYGAH